MKCEYDGTNSEICFSCPFKDCIRDDIEADAIYTEDIGELQEDDHDAIYGEPRWDGKKRTYGKYKGTPYDDEKHKKAREYSYRYRHGLPQPKKTYKCKGNPNYQKEYRAAMPEEQKERYRAWQREYARQKRHSMA